MKQEVFSINPRLDKKMTLEPPGWKKLEVHYSNEIVSNTNYLCWKINETEHIFRIPTRIIYENHGINYKEHFLLTLNVFREDYLEWKKQEFPEEWMLRYKKMYETIIK